ncbi:MAG: M18 family aminopeptidase [Halioglobus sp.]
MQQEDFNRGLCDFIGAAVTPFHAVSRMLEDLQSAGYTVLAEDEPWQLEQGQGYVVQRNGSSLIAFTTGAGDGPVGGMRMVGAHTDSPCLMVKPEPDIVRQGYLQLGVQVYGGALLNPWFDRDLSLAGRVSYRDPSGGLRTALVDFREPLAVIPSLAIHLDREANKNRSVNPQTDMTPLLARVAASGGDAPGLRDILRERVLIEHPRAEVEEILDFELSFYDSQAPGIVGLKQEFIAAARLDNLLSCYTAMQALLASDGSQASLLICNDHEEVGSLSASGAQGPFLRSTLERIAGGSEALAHMVDRSMMISADNAHGVHPNYADKHDEQHGPLLNEGPVIKVNASQRYATNSETAGLFRLLAAQEGVPVQSFVVRADMACGSTIGPITAGATGIRTLDIGVPTFAMHSIRELAGSADACNLGKVLRRFYDRPGPMFGS